MRHCTSWVISVVFAIVAGTANGQEWPTKPVRFIVPAPPAESTDITMRLLGDRLSHILGQPVIVENRPGASGAIGMRAVARSPSDGYTYLFAPAYTIVILPSLLKEAGLDLNRDFTPVAGIGGTPMLIAANPKLGAKTLSEVITLAKAQPGKITVANIQHASLPFLVVELLNQLAGVRLYNVSFGGTTQAVTATIIGDASLVAGGSMSLMSYVKSGKLTAIAVTSPQKLPGFEAYPLANEAVPGLTVMGWMGILSPKGTSTAIVRLVNANVNKVLAMPDIGAKLKDLGMYPMPGTMPGTTQNFTDFIAEERRRWEKVLKAAHIEPQ